jgi:glycerophosphoryl diester phosphodiesterase
MYDHLPNPTIFAHRGASAYAPENTLAAFELAVRQKADGIELDAKLTEDGHVVVIHDQTLERTTNGTGRVSQTSLAGIKTLDAGEHFDSRFKGEPIPTLSDVFEAVGRVSFINVELTNYESPFDPLADKVAAVVKHHNLADRLLFSSFNPVVLRRIHRLLPSVPLGLLALPAGAGALARSVLGRWWVPYQALHPAMDDITPNLVQTCHRRRHRVHTYTVNQVEPMMTCFNLGVDGIFTDDPPLALDTLGKFRQKGPEGI